MSIIYFSKGFVMKTLRIFAVIILAGLCGRIAGANTATINILHSFGISSSMYGSYDGSNPVQPPIEGTDGNFYGTTYGGGTNNDGTVYEMTPEGTLTTLYSFQGYDGYGPRGLLFETNGVFYGTTQGGGANATVSDPTCCGSVFTITPQGVLTTVYSFSGPDGSTSDSGLVPSGDGNFYGTTYGGGATITPYNGTNTDSYGDIVQNPPGTVYKITPEGTLTTLHSFSGPDGANPGKEAVVGTNGNLYGTTLFGGAFDHGTVYTISSAGTFTLLYSFTDGDDGAHPKAQLTQGPDGDFYGTTLDGGGQAGAKQCSQYGCGTVFKISPQGTLTTLHDFSGDQEPAHPGSLTPGPDGNFYGTSYTGGTNAQGTAFMITPQGVVTTLYQFDIFHGSLPIAGLTLASDGSFYGTTTEGGAYAQGTVYRLVVNTNATSSCTFALSAASASLPAKGGAKNVSVKASSTTCAWTAVSNDPFITITSGSGGTGNGKVDYTVAGNTNTAPVSGTMTIAGETFTVNQLTGGCTFKLSPKAGKIKATGGTGTVNVTASLSDCARTAVSNDPFITITAGESGTGKGKVSYTVGANTNTTALTGSITIAGETFAITQAGAK